MAGRQAPRLGCGARLLDPDALVIASHPAGRRRAPARRRWRRRLRARAHTYPPCSTGAGPGGLCLWDPRRYRTCDWASHVLDWASHVLDWASHVLDFVEMRIDSTPTPIDPGGMTPVSAAVGVPHGGYRRLHGAVIYRRSIRRYLPPAEDTAGYYGGR